MYVDGEKFWDLPTAFGDANYNQIIFFIGTYKNTTDKFFISNLKLAEAGADTRHKLIETGTHNENPNVKNSITSHTDADGKNTEKQKLSEQRAESVKNYLNKNFNIDKARIDTNGKGASEPIRDNNSGAGKQQNRRVEFNVLN